MLSLRAPCHWVFSEASYFDEDDRGLGLGDCKADRQVWTRSSHGCK